MDKYRVTFVLKSLARGVTSEAWKYYEKGDIVSEQELKDFAQSTSYIYTRYISVGIITLDGFNGKNHLRARLID